MDENGIDIKEINSNESFVESNSENNHDLDDAARKKIIEQFIDKSNLEETSNNEDSSLVSNETISPDISEKKIVKITKDLFSSDEEKEGKQNNNLDNSLDKIQILDAKQIKTQNNDAVISKAIMLLIILAIFGYGWVKYIEPKIFNVNEILNKKISLSKSDIHAFNIDSTPSFEKNRLESLEVDFDNYKRKNVVKKSPKGKVVSIKGNTVESKISDVWRIKKVNDNGKSVVLGLIGKDREITVSSGDKVYGVGTISYISRSNGSWYVVGSKKIVKE